MTSPRRALLWLSSLSLLANVALGAGLRAMLAGWLHWAWPLPLAA